MVRNMLKDIVYWLKGTDPVEIGDSENKNKSASSPSHLKFLEKVLVKIGSLNKKIETFRLKNEIKKFDKSDNAIYLNSSKTKSNKSNQI